MPYNFNNKPAQLLSQRGYALIVIIFLGGFFNIFGPAIVSGANILVYAVVGSYSQRIAMSSFIEGLADKGHNVTYMSAYDSKDPIPGVHDYVPKLWKQQMGPWEEHIKFFDIRKNRQMVLSWFMIPEKGLLACEVVYSDPDFLSWAKSNHFDLVIVDGLMNECAYSLVYHWKSKLIVYSASLPMGWFSDSFGLPDESSSVTDLMFNFPPGKEMSFLERFVNAMTPLVWKLVREYWYLPKLEDISRKGLGLESMPHFIEIEKNASLVMITTHYTLDYPRSLPPNAVAVGGVAVTSKELKPIPKEIEDFIGKSKEGFIFISFGTVAEFANFDVSVQAEFIKAVEMFPEIKFIWKSSLKILLPLPENVLVVEWAPQQSLLAHPKIKAFISHSGMGSTTEAIHFSVPVISLPVLAEQDINAAGLEAKGAGIKLEITTLRQHELENAITEIVYNPKYRLAMQQLTAIFKDRPLSASQTAVWWTEFVLRHNDTNIYLQPPGVEQSWWVRRQIDVWLFAVVLTITLATVSVCVVVCITKKTARLMFPSVKTGSKKLKKLKKN